MTTVPIAASDLTWLNMDLPTNLMVVNGLMWFDEGRSAPPALSPWTCPIPRASPPAAGSCASTPREQAP